jgi:hypothetical protein
MLARLDLPRRGEAMSISVKVFAAAIALSAMLFGGAAFACDYCNGGYYGGRQIYSCNAGQYDCRYETALYTPRVGDCGYGCHGYSDRTWDSGCGCYRARVHAYIRGYRHGFRDGYETASYGDDRGFYDDGHRWHNWERWQDGDGHTRDGWHDDKGAWHDRDRHDDHGGWRDGDRHDDHDWHDGDHHDGHDGAHDSDGHDDHHDDDHHDGDHHDDHH